jgi:hypothetical protein
MLNQFVEKLSKTFDLAEPLQPNNKGEYVLLLEPSLEILLRENASPGITLFTMLCPLPEKKIDDFLLYTMSANLFGRETGNSFLGCDRDGKMVTLTYFLPSEVSYGVFLDSIEEFANYAESWRQEIVSQLAEEM